MAVISGGKPTIHLRLYYDVFHFFFFLCLCYWFAVLLRESLPYRGGAVCVSPGIPGSMLGLLPPGRVSHGKLVVLGERQDKERFRPSRKQFTLPGIGALVHGAQPGTARKSDMDPTS